MDITQIRLVTCLSGATYSCGPDDSYEVEYTSDNILGPCFHLTPHSKQLGRMPVLMPISAVAHVWYDPD